jgi:hypothetical protein
MSAAAVNPSTVSGGGLEVNFADAGCIRQASSDVK